jgi:ketol-acid reductoisomerase
MTSHQSPRISIIGYGSQGRAHALNLRDSGFAVTIGLRPGGPTEIKAIADGFTVKSPALAARDAELVAVLVPDMVQPQLYRDVLEPNMAKGACLLFAHGFNVHYAQVHPRADLDVVLVAPKGPGALVRREYEIGRGVPSVYAVHQDVSGKAEQLALQYCAGIGGARQNAIRTSFKEETETDLFGEQAVLCGGATKLVQAGLGNPGRRRLPAGSGVLRMPARTEVDRRPVLRGRHHAHARIHQRDRAVRRTDPWRIRDRRPHPRADAQDPGEIQDGSFARQWIAEIPGRQRQLQGTQAG